MKFWDIVKTVGGAVVSNVGPGGAASVNAVNAFLPDDSKLSESATGDDVATAIQSLPADQRASVMNKELDVTMTEIKESHSTVRAMLEADTKTPHTTRPYIAKGSFHVIAFTIITVISVWAYGVFIKDTDIIKAVMDGWPFVLAVMGPLVVLLHAYFGVLKQEQKNKLDAANGVAQPSGIAGMLAGMFGGKK